MESWRYAVVPIVALPLVGGPYHGRTRPIVEGEPPAEITMIEREHRRIAVYVLRRLDDGTLVYCYATTRAITIRSSPTR